MFGIWPFPKKCWVCKKNKPMKGGIVCSSCNRGHH